MEFFPLIQTRESIRNYDPHRPVPRETLDRILEAGRLAPSAANLQPWRFLMVSSPALLEKVRACYRGDWFREAPHVLIVKGDKSKAWVRKEDGYNAIETDLTIAMDHMILAAENEGVATCWIAAFAHAALREVLALTENERIFAISPLGYPKNGFTKKGTKSRKPLNEVAQHL